LFAGKTNRAATNKTTKTTKNFAFMSLPPLFRVKGLNLEFHTERGHFRPYFWIFCLNRKGDSITIYPYH